MDSKIAVFLLLTLIISFAQAQEAESVDDRLGLPANWTNCGTRFDVFNVSNVTLSTKPALNVSETVYVLGNMTQTENVGRFDVLIYVNGSKVASDSVPDPAYVPMGSIWAYEYTSLIPFNAPLGNYQVNITLYDNQNNSLSCTSVAFIITSKSIIE
jgi:hypothetical protein